MIKPIENINNMAQNMLIKIASDGYNKHTAIKEYLHYANENSLESNALVAFHTQRRSLRNNSMLYGQALRKGISNILDVIDSEVNKSPELKNEATDFINNFNKKYPKTGKLRSIYARYGFVNSEKVKPIPLYRSLFRKAYSNVYKFINNVKESELYKILTDTNPNHSEALK